MSGFLTSLELRDAGFQSNNGHYDQRTALRWIKQYISGFGGDPDRVTVAGESIGGRGYPILTSLTHVLTTFRNSLCTTSFEP
jgi:carboxylesterase type B